MDETVKNLSDFLKILDSYKEQFSQTYRNSGFVFRGMGNASWQLIPGMFREYSEKQICATMPGISYKGRIYSAHEYEILAHFKKEASGLLTHVPQTDDFTWIQYAQHYGVPTRLLDFTSNPLVAMYFCCQSESKGDGAIWIVNTVNFERWSQDEIICSNMGSDYTREAMMKSIMREMRGDFDYGEVEGEPRLKKMRPVLFIPPYIDQRMSAQSSRFMIWGNITSGLESMIKAKENLMELSSNGVTYRQEDDQRFLAKLIVPEICKHNIMRELDLLNINEKSIFPGLDGIGRYVNKYYKNNADDVCTSFL